jgi:hypothetical protein
MVGLAVSPETQLGVLAAVVVGGVVAESAWERHRGRKGSPAPAVGLAYGTTRHLIDSHRLCGPGQARRHP